MSKLDPISAMRRSYGEEGITSLPENPLDGIRLWLADAAANTMIVEPNAMVLSTNQDGQPSARTVLLKGIDSGLTFFTNYRSRKASEIASNPLVSLLFPWYPMERQIIVLGRAEKVSAEESDLYFASRPWSSQIGALSSDQSAPLAQREELQRRWDETSTRYPEGSVVPRPDWWGGFRVIPMSIEFWQGRYSRLHDRMRYTRDVRDMDSWKCGRLFP